MPPLLPRAIPMTPTHRPTPSVPGEAAAEAAEAAEAAAAGQPHRPEAGRVAAWGQRYHLCPWLATWFAFESKWLHKSTSPQPLLSFASLLEVNQLLLLLLLRVLLLQQSTSPQPLLSFASLLEVNQLLLLLLLLLLLRYNNPPLRSHYLVLVHC